MQQTEERPARDTEEYEHQVVGPPGTGKTTWLCQQVIDASEEGASPLVICYSRASVQEVLGRELPINPDRVGTLHSLCYQAQNRPLIAEAHLENWNTTQPEVWQLKRADYRRNLENGTEEMPRASNGDRLMAQLQQARSRMETDLPKHLETFAAAWQEWKNRNGLSDYTDLVEKALAEGLEPPHEPDMIFVDESQDLDKLQMSLIRKWGEQAGCLVLVGDPDQTIYTWRGADPSIFIGKQLPEGHKRILAQSYRVPAKVHQVATQWIDEIEGREPHAYLPAEREGDVRRLDASYNEPEALIADAMKYIMEDQQVMFMATCSYMLEKLIDRLRLEGVGFHNPMARTNGQWNPLMKRANQVTAADRIVAYMALSTDGGWTAEQLDQWTGVMPVKGILPRKGRELVKQLQNQDDGMVSWDDLTELLDQKAIDAALTGDLEWYGDNLMDSKKKTSAFPLGIAKRYGVGALTDRPKAVVGTIHSIKGSETDVAYVFPDLSRRGMEEWHGAAEQQNALYRLFYVAMTRPRHTLVLCQAAEWTAIEWPEENPEEGETE